MPTCWHSTRMPAATTRLIRPPTREASCSTCSTTSRPHPFEGHELDAYVAVDPKNQDEVKQALYYFGGLYIGVQLPLLAQTQTVWDVPWTGTLFHNARPGSWGGHCVAGILDYDEVGLTAITWGSLKHMTWKWLETYCDEAYCILSPDWYGSGRLAPTGFNSVQLAADLTRAGGELMVDKWMQDAVKPENKGALRKELHVKAGEKIPAKKLAKAAHSSNPKLRKRAALAKTFKKFGGKKS
jgi:hypothetical protein